ncbi:MAG: gephyrin-like molybdotransferase Glp [Desulfovibrionaceae bacterium]
MSRDHGFLDVLPRPEFEALLAAFSPLPGETAPLAEAAGRFLAAGVTAPEDLPPAPRAGMDGFAVFARDTFGASESNPAYLEPVGEIRIDRLPDLQVGPGQCAAIPTGGWLPEGADAVVMVEHADRAGDLIEIRKSVAPGEHVMQAGEDARAGTEALTAGTRLAAPELALLAALGTPDILARRRPRVGILSSGDELVPFTEPAGPGRVRDVNALALAALAAEAGGLPERLGIVPDDLGRLTRALSDAVERSDLVCISGGSSVGVRDLTVAALTALPDSELLAHGVAISPGKPTLLGRVGDTPVLGLPGQVASAQVVAVVLACPLIRHLAGDPRAFTAPRRPLRRAELARNQASKPGREDFVRVALAERAGRPPLATPVTGKSGLLRTLLRSDGLMPIPAAAEGLEAGTLVDVWLL